MAALSNLYSDRKAAHVAAYLLRLSGGSMSLLKLMKLVYMAEKYSYAKYGDPMIGDTPYSLKDGPLLEKVYDSAKGKTAENSVWNDYIAPREHNTIRLVNPQISVSDLGSLSDADVEILEKLWRKFGGMSPYEVRDYCHDNFPEWENPGAGSAKISIPKLLVGVGYNKQEADQIYASIMEQAEAQGKLAAIA